MKKSKLKKILLTTIPLSLIGVASVSTAVLVHSNDIAYNSSSNESTKNINNEKVNNVNNYKYKFNNKVYDSIDDATNDYLSMGNLNREKMIGEFKQVSGSYALNMDDARKYDNSKMSIAYKTVNNEYTKDFSFAQKSYQNARYETKYYDYNGQWFDSYDQASDSIIKNIKPTGIPHYQIKPDKDTNETISINPFNKYDKNRAVMIALESLSKNSKSNFSSDFYYKENVANGNQYRLLERKNLYETIVEKTFNAFFETFVDIPFINLEIKLLWDNEHNKYSVNDKTGDREDYEDDGNQYKSYKSQAKDSEIENVFKYNNRNTEGNYFKYLKEKVNVSDNTIKIPGLTLNMLYNDESPWRNLTNRSSISQAWGKGEDSFATYEWIKRSGLKDVAEEMEFNLFGHRINFKYEGNCKGLYSGVQLKFLEQGHDYVWLAGVAHDSNKSVNFKHSISTIDDKDYVRKSFLNLFKNNFTKQLDSIKEKNNFLKWDTIEKSIFKDIENNLYSIVNYIISNNDKFINKEMDFNENSANSDFYNNPGYLSEKEKNVFNNETNLLTQNKKLDVESIWKKNINIFLPLNNSENDKDFVDSSEINQYFNNLNNSFNKLFNNNGMKIDNTVNFESPNNETPVFVIFYNNAPLFEFNLNIYNEEWKKIDKNVFSYLNKNDIFNYLNNLKNSSAIIFKNLLTKSNILDSFVNISNNIVTNYMLDTNRVNNFTIQNKNTFEIDLYNNTFKNYTNSSSDFTLPLDSNSGFQNYDFKNLLYFYNENNSKLKIESNDLIVFRTENYNQNNSIGEPINLYYAEFLSNGIDYDKSIESLPIYKTFDELEKAKISKNNLKPLDVICLKDNNNMIINDDIFNENGTLNKENYDMYNPLDLIRSNIARTYAIKNSKDYVYYQDGNNEILLKNNISNLYKLFLNKNDYYFYNFEDAKTFLYEYIKINSEIV